MAGRQSSTKKKTRRFYDYSLVFIIVFISIFGLIMIYSSSCYTAQLKYKGDSFYFVRRQGLITLASFFVMMFISKINYHFFAKFAAVAYITSYVCMVLVLFTPLGREFNGKKRWLGVGSATIQPAELVKVALILVLACVINYYGKKVDEWIILFLLVGLTLPIAGLVVASNLSSGIIICGIAFVMAFVASKKKLRFFVVVAMGLGVAFLAVEFGHYMVDAGILHDYQFERIYVWQDPEAYASEGGYQVLQGLYAIGSGGIFGRGLGESIQKMGFVPEAQNDMIFSIICEELGLFGAVSVILLFLFMIWRFMVIANNAPDLFGSMLVVGVMAHIAIQVILNIAVVTNTIPNTGITLPFISYGGTSVLFLMVEMGMVLSVSNQIKIEK